MHATADTWLILGSSPSAARLYPIVRRQADVVATCNNGLAIEPTPDLYWLTDSVAVDLYRDAAHGAKARGTRIITSTLAVTHRPILAELADEVLDYDVTQTDRWSPGHLRNCRTSGGMLLQLAVLRGAARVVMVGMEGYRSSTDALERDYFDGRTGSASHGRVMGYYWPFVQSLIDQSPQVAFELHGKPVYPLVGDNFDRVLRVAVLCPGPSLAKLKPEALAPYAQIIGVNAAVEGFRCDWWCFGDYSTFDKFAPLPAPYSPANAAPCMFVGSNVGDNIDRQPYGPAFRQGVAMEWQRVHERPSSEQWATYSATAALVLASELGATHVDVYGADMRGIGDFQGRQCLLNRNFARWELERKIFSDVTDWLKSGGVTVRRLAA